MAGGDSGQHSHLAPLARVVRASHVRQHAALGYRQRRPADLLLALASDDESLARERERLWYAACTRARELLVVPELPQAEQRSWARIVDLAHQDLPLLDLSRFDRAPRPAAADLPNGQTQDMFETERAAIAAAAVPLTWLQPSKQDPDSVPMTEAIAIDSGDAPETELPIGAGRFRGLVLHKLMEEVLTAELDDDLASFAHRARALIAELVVDREDEVGLPEADEIASTAWRTLHLPEIAALRPGLVPEWPIYALLADASEPTALAGRIDAVALEEGRAAVVLDWKSDIAPTEEDMRIHAGQLEDYLRTTGARRGALVYMTLGTVRWVEPGVRTERNP
ncbi:PD-(D/E)XK nuclease family protein [Mesorhizobium sp. L48C026A00]|uniref:PD-(D/E)XK nuclease family protein n=1 Tax=Mesorhizobium sp. L48C026A00 TaxID=1287182 RepID=UPI001FD8B78F|nr:PD-(D/E)XK nuclease family protein [Mesorhizobium sp. L48C026A00]